MSDFWDREDDLLDEDEQPRGAARFFRDDRGAVHRIRVGAPPQSTPGAVNVPLSEEHHEAAQGMPFGSMMRELLLRMVQYALAGAFQAAAQFFSTRRRFK